MNDLTALESYVTAHPDERTPARALVDMHEEVLDVPRPVALKAVARIHRAALQAREMADAANAIRADAPNSMSIKAMIVMAAEADDGRPITIYLVPGRRSPRGTCSDWHGDGQHYPYWTITVGALYVLAVARGFDLSDPAAVMPSWMYPDDEPTD